MVFNRNHRHQLKRLDPSHQQHKRSSTAIDLASHLCNEIYQEKSWKYVKYFDYPLAELLFDHSTDPLQNTTRQFATISSSSSSINHPSEERFANLEILMRRRHGETTILRPQLDPVLTKGFAPIIRTSPFLPHMQPLQCSSAAQSSNAMITKMSLKKSNENFRSRQKLNRRKRNKKKFHRRSDLSDGYFPNGFDESQWPDLNFAPQMQQDFQDNQDPFQPVPLMSILPEFPARPENYINLPRTQRYDDSAFTSMHPFHEHSFNPEPNLMPQFHTDPLIDNFSDTRYSSFAPQHSFLETIRDERSQWDTHHFYSPMLYSNSFIHRSGFFF